MENLYRWQHRSHDFESKFVSVTIPQAFEFNVFYFLNPLF